MSFNFMVGMSDYQHYCLEPTPTGFSYHTPTAVTTGHSHNQNHTHSHTSVNVTQQLNESAIDAAIANAGFRYQDPPMIHHEPVPPPVVNAAANAKEEKKVKKERKRRAVGATLSRAELKRRRNAGEEYVTRKGKVVQKKEFEAIDCKCRLGCTVKVPQDVRKLIFDQFHALADWNNQTQFIVSSVTVLDVNKRKKKMNSELTDPASQTFKRTASRIFYLTCKKVRVCKPVFLSTLGITNKRLDYALRHKALPLTAVATPDFRGKKCPQNKTPLEVESRIRAHIKSFPMSSSSRVKSGKATQYLTPDLTISKMYSLYQEQCRAEGISPASMWVYSKVFHSESKIHLSLPKKESACKKCERTKIILQSGEEPTRIIQMLMKEYQDSQDPSPSKNKDFYKPTAHVLHDNRQ